LHGRTTVAGRDSRDEAAAAGALEAAALVFLLVHRAGSGARTAAELGLRTWVFPQPKKKNSNA